MRKTRFFYIRQLFLLVLLGWLVLLQQAVSINIKEKTEYIRQEKQKQEMQKQEMQKQEEAKEQEIRRQEEKQEQEVQKQEEVKETIRVLLMDTDYKSYYHPSVTVAYGGHTDTYTVDSPALSEGSLLIGEQPEGIQVLSIERYEGNPVYQGTLEIRREEDGLILVNSLSLEDYLTAVVPSEMPSSYAPEALKAQAVCARTYAKKQIQEESLSEYQADVDDSVNFQVYQNISPKETTTRAVLDTQGQVLCQNGELIEAYYFSTSAGATSTDEVWGAEEAASYLKSVECGFDSQEPWSCWQVQIPWKNIEQRLWEQTGNTSTLQALEIVKKNQSGAVTGLRAVMETGSVEFSEEYGIRKLFSPLGCMITEKDGTQTEGTELLPSAYFSMEAIPGECVSLSGKGYGHGVGMSQNAANRMAEEGYTYQEILNYFFRDVEITESGMLVMESVS